VVEAIKMITLQDNKQYPGDQARKGLVIAIITEGDDL
jgi:hypothetical protein